MLREEPAERQRVPKGPTEAGTPIRCWLEGQPRAEGIAGSCMTLGLRE